MAYTCAAGCSREPDISSLSVWNSQHNLATCSVALAYHLISAWRSIHPSHWQHRQHMVCHHTRACMQVFLLEGENKKLTRALVREVGEGIPMQKVLEEGSGADWRGRREQIIRLQDTVRQLREAAAAAAAGAGRSDGQAAANSSSSSVGGSLAKHEAAHRTQISKANKQKDSELQRMAAELAAAKAATEQLRLKFTGASSRRKILEEEVSS